MCSLAFQSESGSAQRSRDNATFRGNLHGTAFAWEMWSKCVLCEGAQGFSNRRFERRFWVLLPPWAKVPRARRRGMSLWTIRREGCSAPVGAVGGCGYPPLRTAIGGHSVGGDAHIAPYATALPRHISPSVTAFGRDASLAEGGEGVPRLRTRGTDSHASDVGHWLGMTGQG